MNAHSRAGTVIDVPRLVFRRIIVDGQEAQAIDFPLGSHDRWPHKDHLDFAARRAFGKGEAWRADFNNSSGRVLTIETELVDLDLRLRYRYQPDARSEAGSLWVIEGPHLAGKFLATSGQYWDVSACHPQHDVATGVTAHAHKVDCDLCRCFMKWSEVVLEWRARTDRSPESWREWRTHFINRWSRSAELWPTPPELPREDGERASWMEAP